LGFNFWPRSPRYIAPRAAADIIAQLPPLVTSVAVVVDEPPAQVARLARRSGVRAVQLHGQESQQDVAALAADGFAVLKAVRVGRDFRPQQLRSYVGVDAFLLDTEVKGRRGGTGKSFDWKKARAANRYGRVLLAGGLTVENVGEAVAQARPYGVDVCSGVERRPGNKDHDLLREFIRRAKGV
ncbi:MAG: N-(5'-phosphoribosyl)anthranilate isomerase, partial [Candidatus Acidiferrales bacterium]